MPKFIFSLNLPRKVLDKRSIISKRGKAIYYIATLFIIPLFTCLIVVFGWDLDNRKG